MKWDETPRKKTTYEKKKQEIEIFNYYKNLL